MRDITEDELLRIIKSNYLLHNSQGFEAAKKTCILSTLSWPLGAYNHKSISKPLVSLIIRGLVTSNIEDAKTPEESLAAYIIPT